MKIYLNEFLSLNLRPVDCEALPGKRVALKVARDSASAYVADNLRCTLEFSDESACKGVIRQVKTLGNYLCVDLEREE